MLAGMRYPAILSLALGSASFGCAPNSVAPTDGPGQNPGDATSTSLADLSVLGDLAAVPDLAVSGYPPGPYGRMIGDTIPPLVWEGYVNPTADARSDTKPYGPYSMDALRMSGAPYGLVHVSEFY
jgi:hypothetical protein